MRTTCPRQRGMRQVALLSEPRLSPQQLQAAPRERCFRGGPLHLMHVFQTQAQGIDCRKQLCIDSALGQGDEQKPTIPDDLRGHMQISRMHSPSSSVYVQQSDVLSALSPCNHPAVSSAVPACIASASEERGCKHLPDEYISARQRAARRVWLPPQQTHWGSRGRGEDHGLTRGQVSLRWSPAPWSRVCAGGRWHRLAWKQWHPRSPALR